MPDESATVLPQEGSRRLLRDADEALEQHQEDHPAVLEALSLPEVHELLHMLVHGLADGRPIRIEIGASTLGAGGSIGDYSPQAAADALGVSRTLVNKLIDTGELHHYTLPGSTHKKIPRAEVERLLRERAAKRTGVDAIIDDLMDAGAEY